MENNNKKIAGEEVKYLMGFKAIFLTDEKGNAYVRRYKKSICSLLDAGVKQSDIYDKLKKDGKITTLSFEQFSKILSRDNKKKIAKESTKIECGIVESSVSLIADKSSNEVDLNCAQSVIFKKALIEASSETKADFWIKNASNLSNAEKFNLSQALKIIPEQKKVGDLFKLLLVSSKQ